MYFYWRKFTGTGNGAAEPMNMVRRILIPEQPFRERRPGAAWPEWGVWPAKWIAPAEGEAAGMRATLFRCDIEMERQETVRLHLAADAVYRFWIDGVYVASGPEQGDRNHTFFDTFDWEAGAGAHRLTVLVTSFGGSGPFSRMEFAHGLLLAAAGAAGARLNSCAANWRAAGIAGIAGRDVLYGAGSVGQELVFDLAGWPEGAERGEGVAFGPVVEGESGSNAGMRNEYRPVPLLEPAALPEMAAAPVGGWRVVCVSPSEGRRLPADGGDSERAAEWERGLKQGNMRVPPHCSLRVLLELDDYYCGCPELTVSGGAGSELAVGWCEALAVTDEPSGRKDDRREWRGRYFHGIYDRFRMDGRRGAELFTLHYRAGRFVSIEVRTGAEPLEIDRFSLRESRYPVEFAAAFECGDDRFAECFRLACRTLEMCSHDTFMDCPFYEQLQYVGDTRIQALVTLAATPDDRLVRKALRLFASSQLESGLVQSRYPSRVTQVIPTFTPYFVGMVLDWAKWRGGALARELFPAARRGTDAFERWLNRDGLLEINRSWNFVDWPGWKWGVPPDGEFGVSGVLNAQYLYTLEMTSELCELMEAPELAAHYRRRLAEQSERFVRAFWRPDAGLFADSLAGDAFSEHAQVFALLSHALPEEIRERCAATLFRRRDLTEATVYFTFYLFEVYREFNRPDLLIERLKIFFDMNTLGLKTMLEAPEPSRSDCHAWSAHPIWHFLTSLLGVRPAGAGFRQVEVRPQPGPLPFVRGKVCHPAGMIEVECDAHSARVVLPAGVTGRFIAPDGRSFALGGGADQIEFQP